MQDDVSIHFKNRISKALKSEKVSLIPSVLRDTVQRIGDYTSISSDGEMQEFINDVLEEAIRGFRPRLGISCQIVGQDHKWRYSSAYQKAVRRNDPSISAVASALNMCDPAYIWRRAPTIALEDIGLGDPWVCATVLHACRFAKIRARHSPDRLSAFLGELMGSAVKDRLSCDSFCLPYLHPELATVREAVDGMSNCERADLYRSDDTPFGCRVAAGISLAGSRYGGDVFSSVGGSPELLAEATEGLAPYPIRWISRQYSKMARDGMFVAMPLVWRQLILESQISVERGNLPPRRLIDGVLSASFDAHTRDGRKAIMHFGNECAPVRRLLVDRTNWQQQIRLAVFTADSSLLDRQIKSPWSAALYSENLRGEALAAGLQMEQFQTLARAVADNLDELEEVRIRVTS